MTRDRILLAAALTAPALVALMAPRLGIGSAPSRAMASGQTQAAPALPPTAALSVTPAQRAALDRIAELRGGAGLESPFLEPTEETVTPEDVPTAESPDWSRRIQQVANLSTVFGGSRGAGAMINGKLFGEGDEIAEGVVIESIDVAGRSVVVRTPEGERYQLTMPARRDEPTVVTKLE